MRKAMYAVVTKDKDRLIRCIADSPQELAALIGKSESAVVRAFAINRYRNTKNSKYEIIIIDE